MHSKNCHLRGYMQATFRKKSEIFKNSQKYEAKIYFCDKNGQKFLKSVALLLFTSQNVIDFSPNLDILLESQFHVKKSKICIYGRLESQFHVKKKK